MHRLIVTGWVALLEQKFQRVFLGLLATNVYLIVLLYVRPYKTELVDTLSIGSMFCLVFVFMGATVLELYEELSILYGDGASASVLGFSSQEQIVYVMIALTFVLLLLLTGLVLYHVINARALPIFRIMELHEPPELNLKTGMVWHLFLSRAFVREPERKELKPT